MTINITVASPRFVISVTDRRIANMMTGKILSERSTKLTQLRCADALALITYNGIGGFQGKTPADWLQELDNKVGLTKLPFKDVLQEIRKDIGSRISRLPKTCRDRRHTFVLGVWGQGKSWIFGISNYETVCSDAYENAAQDQFSISVLPELPGKETRVVVTGSIQHFDRNDMVKIGSVARKSGAAGIDIKNLCVKAIQNAASRKKKEGGISTSVLWAIAERFRDVQGGLDVPGGTTVHEMPNIISPGVQFKDIRIEATNSEPISWDKPFPLPEIVCRNCKSPIPLGYKECGVCRKKVN